MKFRQLIIGLISIILLGGCSAFFQKISGVDEIQKVAIVSVLLHQVENNAPKSSATRQTHSDALPNYLNGQALLEFAYIQLQHQIETQFQWQTHTDIRNSLSKHSTGANSDGSESLHGLSIISASSVYALASGNPSPAATQDFIKELCLQLDVDALVMMSIDIAQQKNGLLDKLKKERITPSVLINLAVVNSRGQIILNTKYFDDATSGPSLTQDTLTQDAVLDSYKVATSNALEDYFYRSSMIFKRMGYQLSRIKDFSGSGDTKQLPKPTGATINSDTPQLNESSGIDASPAQQPAKKGTSGSDIKTIGDTNKNDQENNQTKPKRRSIWSLPDETNN